MKKNSLVLAALLAGLALTACSGGASDLEKAADEMKKDMTEAVDEATEEAKDEVEAEAETESTSSVMYQCPIDCENGPAYPKAGPCKKCGEEMVEI